MFTKKQHERPGLEKAIEAALSELDGFTADQPEYDNIMTQLERLYALRETPAKEARKPLSADAIVNGAVSLLGIGLILGFERGGIITTKALGFVKKTS